MHEHKAHSNEITDDALIAYGKSKKSIEYWESARHSFSDLYPSEQYHLKTKLALSQSVLDVGCAGGGGANFTREINPRIEYTGIDTSENLIALARKKENSNTHFSVYNGHDLTFNDHHYDLVFSLGVLHHLSHWKSLFEQMYSKANHFICFDLRLTHDIDPSLENPEISFQKIAFNEPWDGVTRVPYLVLNFSKTLQYFEDFLQPTDVCEIYGYYGAPTSLAVTPAKKVLMASFCVQKNHPQSNHQSAGFKIQYAKK